MIWLPSLCFYICKVGILATSKDYGEDQMKHVYKSALYPAFPLQPLILRGGQQNSSGNRGAEQHFLFQILGRNTPAC